MMAIFLNGKKTVSYNLVKLIIVSCVKTHKKMQRLDFALIY